LVYILISKHLITKVSTDACQPRTFTGNGTLLSFIALHREISFSKSIAIL
jgi:hypothetical protein